MSDGALFTFSPTQEATDPVPTVTADMILASLEAGKPATEGLTAHI